MFGEYGAGRPRVEENPAYGELAEVVLRVRNDVKNAKAKAHWSEMRACVLAHNAGLSYYAIGKATGRTGGKMRQEFIDAIEADRKLNEKKEGESDGA